MRSIICVALVLTLIITVDALAQQAPVTGMRPADLRTHAITNVTVIPSPGERIESANILIRDGVIIAVGPADQAAPPPGAWIWPGDKLTVYPGLIESALLIEPGDRNASAGNPGAHWNHRITPEARMSEQPPPSASLRKDLRSLGFTTAAVYPNRGILRGTGNVIALAEEDEHVLAYRDSSFMAAGFEHGGRWESATYPGSLMGAIALFRQTMLDAQWHAECRRMYAENPTGLEPPIRADALVALGDVITKRQRVLFDTSDEQNALRAARLAHEFDLDMILLGSGLEFRRLHEIAALNMPIIVPVQYPERPSVSTLATADRVSLRDMMTWEQAPTNPRRLANEGVEIALTTHRLDRRSGFFDAVRKAIEHGLSEDDALAALTTTPARLLGIERTTGTIAPGMAANLVVVKGGLFEKDAKIRDVWVNGRRHEISKDPDIVLVGKGVLKTDLGHEFEIEFDTVKRSVALVLDEEKKARARNVTVQRDHLSFIVDAAHFSEEPRDESEPSRPRDGFVRFSGAITAGIVTGNGVMPDGSSFTFTIEPTELREPEDEPVEEEADDERENDEPREEVQQVELPPPPEELVFPLGEYGFAEPPRKQSLLITNATIWTSGPTGIIENGWMEVRDGKIVGIGAGEPALRAQSGPSSLRSSGPASEVLVVDAAGKHITPGLIDCHSHTGITGGVNEWTHVNTAEVRIADVINPDDINWYRQLAGGLTAANQLHGSANPIGGQNSIVKLKWGAADGADAMRVEDARPGIKFALGENVVRTQTRYPNTRMGVETVLRDAFTAAREYDTKRNRNPRNRSYPVRPDLELDALVEILRGERDIHCHSYRQDEILALMRVAEDLGFRVATFQHILEGYKVAEVMAEHGAHGSAFSDWWAYKVEVMDAIPYAGAIMHEVGVNVSFNSDSAELARRMNTEAAKAVRYGGVPRHEALKFVTINPAIQMGIDHRTGSLEVGKDADFVIWSGDPLSTYTRAEQTWIEGAMFFCIEKDLELREHVQNERQRLIQKILLDEQRDGPGARRDESNGERPRDRRRRPRLMESVIEQHVRAMENMVRMGIDPEEIRPGECGCNEWWYWLR